MVFMSMKCIDGAVVVVSAAYDDANRTPFAQCNSAEEDSNPLTINTSKTQLSLHNEKS